MTGIPQYLFPSAFLSILNSQLPDGSWDAHLVTQSTLETPNNALPMLSNNSDSYLSTMAALYTSKNHIVSSCQIHPARLPGLPLHERITLVISSLQGMLCKWQIDCCNSVGFEILIPGLLDLLRLQGYNFDFPDREKLFKVRNSKMARLESSMSQGVTPIVVLHSLEAFHGQSIKSLGTSYVKEHLIHGSVMARPAATASCLMKSPIWDEEAETYIRLIIGRGREWDWRSA